MTDRCLPRDQLETRLSIALIGNISIPDGVPAKNVKELDILGYPTAEDALAAFPEWAGPFDDENEFIEADQLKKFLVMEEEGYCTLNAEYDRDARFECQDIEPEILDELMKKTSKEDLNKMILDFASTGQNLKIRYEGAYYEDEEIVNWLEDEGYIENEDRASGEPLILTDEVCERQPSGKWYHGTTSKNFGDIVKKGLTRGTTVFCRPGLEERRVCKTAVYLTEDEDTAKWYAYEVASVQGGEPMVVTVDLGDGSAFPDILPDEDMDMKLSREDIANLRQCCPKGKRASTLLDWM